MEEFMKIRSAIVVLTYCKDENAPKNCDEREERSLLALKM
jgi:hypothetical protein